MLSISKPQTNLIYLSILVGRLDLTRFSIFAVAKVYWPQFVCSFACASLLCVFGYSVSHSFMPHISLTSQCNCVRAGGSLTCKSMITHLWALPNGDPAGNRTRVFGVRGRRLNRLTTGPYIGQLRTRPRDCKVSHTARHFLSTAALGDTPASFL